MNVLLLGGSRNIGYFAAQRLLANGATVTFLLRNKSCFDTDESMRPHIASGRARLVQGDALKEEDIRQAWNIASGDAGPPDTVLFTIGGTGTFSLTKGIILSTPDLCTRSMLNLLAVFPHDTASQPKLILISSSGLGKTAHRAVPILVRPVYAMIDGPLADKLGMERVVRHVAGWDWPAADGEPNKDILPNGWQERVGSAGWLKNVVIVRPVLLTSGACIGDSQKSRTDKAPYRASSEELKSSYTVSRKDVAHFIVTQVLKDWKEWEGNCVRIAY